MRADYPLYIVAIICFIVAGYGYAYPFTEPSTNFLLVVTLTILGVVFAGTGYAFREKETKIVTAKPASPQKVEAPPPPPPPSPPVVEKKEEPPEQPPPMETVEEKPSEETVTPSETPSTKPPSTRRRRKKTA